MMSDPRARRVIERAAAMAGWDPGHEGGTGSGRGIAFSRYKNHAAYAAIVAEIEVEEEVRVRRLWAAVDAGLVINPDGAVNQIEGGSDPGRELGDEGAGAVRGWPGRDLDLGHLPDPALLGRARH
jgi:CO/xanthine dehydrogenase Mo-binding subunit